MGKKKKRKKQKFYEIGGGYFIVNFSPFFILFILGVVCFVKAPFLCSKKPLKVRKIKKNMKILL